MHIERERLLQLSLILTDVGAITLAFLLSFWVRGRLLVGAFGPIYPLHRYLWLYLVTAVSLPLFLALLRAYEADGAIKKRDPSLAVAGRVFQGVLLEFALVSVLGFTLRLYYVSRLLALLFLFFCYSLLLWSRILLWPVLHRRAQREPLNVLLVGTGEKAKHLLSVLAGHQTIRLSVLGFLSEKPVPSDRFEGYPVLGAVGEAERVLSTHVVDEVLIGLPERSLNDLEPLLVTCERLGVTARLACDLVPEGSARVYLEQLNGMPLLSFTTIPNNPNVLVFKRVVDVLGSFLLLITTAPLFLMVPVLIKLTSRGPVFYRQIRCGLNGRRFMFRKFRSMVDGADELRKEIEHLNEAKEPVFKICEDPRVTALGRFLRRSSIDELPQLFNVLRGEMSLVGPRPPLPEEVDRYQPWQRRRLSMKPGLTCLWQISGRSELGFDDWVALDLRYIDNWSPWLDFLILLKTVPAVLIGKGAQ